MKFTSVIVLASALLTAAPAFAAPGTKENRGFDSRELLEEFYGREVSEVELAERDPFFPLLFGALLRVGAQVATRVAPRIGAKIAKKAVKHEAKHQYDKHQQKKKGKRSLDEFEEFLQERDFDDLLEERDLFDDEVYVERDFDELD